MQPATSVPICTGGFSADNIKQSQDSSSDIPTLKHSPSAREPILLINAQSQQDAHVLFKNPLPVEKNKINK